MAKVYYEEEGIQIYHGDCLEVLPFLAGVDAVVTDPPYGIAYCHGARRGGVRLGTDCQAIQGDDKPFDPSPWLRYGVVVLWGANHYASRLPDSSRWLIWDKRDGIPSNDQADCETAWTNQNGVARLKTRYWNGAQATECGEKRVHSNQKPVALMQWSMEQAGVPEGATVLDPFMGSGTTGIACIRTGRKFIGIEIDQRHCDSAVERVRCELSRGVLPFSAESLPEQLSIEGVA